MDDLITWLRAQMDDDEAYALAVEGDGHWDCPSTGVLQLGGVEDMDGLMLGPRAVVYHAERWDPARVLAEIDAKRRMLDVILGYEAEIDGEWGCAHTAEQIAAGECSSHLPDEIEAIKLLALPYADRPGYRDEWRIEGPTAAG